ncbi:MAG: presenilin family intramembrane aspartyl protease [Candidatus Nanohaloarchaea archaeon]|nr:presenilin family intramembrane aspartyl protease [Candidatus Nanohaloarchaea archaeon]
MDERFRPPLLLAGFFMAANLLGVAAGLRLQGAAAVQQASAAYQAPAAGAVFFAVLVAATALLLLLYRWHRELLVKLWFSSALILTAFILFNAFLPALPAAAFTAVFAVLRFRTGDMLLRNALDTVPFAGTGALFGSLLSLRAVLVFAGLLAVYDYIAVNHIGHMQTLAKAGAASDMFMGFQYPKHGAVQEAGSEAVTVDRDGGEVQVGMLGGGDVVLPMVLAVAVAPLFGAAASVAVVAGSAAALLLFLVAIQQVETDRFYPAIPVVGSGAVLGLVLYLAAAAL